MDEVLTLAPLPKNVFIEKISTLRPISALALFSKIFEKILFNNCLDSG